MDSINRGDGIVQREGTVPSMSLLQGSSNFTIQNSNQTHGNAIRFGDGEFTQDQRSWICDYISTNVSLPDINVNLNQNFLTQLIINLPRAEAVFNDYQNKKKSGPCFEGTRVALLREMADWVTDIYESRMYILAGLAGIGKSTVAYTIASRAANLNLLGASFFFSRDEADRNNAKKLFTTIAYQLCLYNEAFAKAIGDALQTERGSAATTKDPQEQLQALILNPLRNIVRLRTRPILVVIDALDECDEDEEYTVIMALNQLARDLPSFKVILTTCPKPYLDRFLCNQHGHKLFHLQDIEDKVVDSDIRLYLKHSLSLEQVREHYFKRQWFANDEEIDALVHAAGRLFIIASMAVRYILDKFARNPAAQMRNLLRAFAENRTPFKDLDHFYTVILRNVVPVDCDNDGIFDRYQSVVGTIISVQRPLPVSTLSHLTHTDDEEIRVVLDHLQSVILLGDDDVPRIYHKSFPDYLTDRARCKDAHLRIDPMITHTQIATCCFEIANKHLKYNILGLGKTARYMSNEEGLKEDRITYEQLQEKIPEQLRYACVYWADHLQVATIEDSNLMNGLSKFVREHTLHWIEVLSIIGNLDSAHRALRLALKLLDSMSSDLQQLLSDALRFNLKFYEIIERSALHTYYSALPFSPTDSVLYRKFINETEHNICVVEGGPQKWDALIASPSHGQNIDFIKFSPDSTLLFSCSEEHVTNGIHVEGKLKFWDATTGTPVSTIPGQRFAVSNDFSTIASSKDNVITYYNLNGSKRGSMVAISSKIRKLALSENCRISAVFSDGSVSLWNTKDAELIDIFGEFKGTEDRLRLHFSSTGTRLAYSLVNGNVIKLRDGMSGEFIADMQCGLSWHDFVFSGDGSRIATLSYGHLKLWSSESGALIGDIRDVGWGGPGFAISENGSLLATSDSKNVTLWRENHDHLIQIEVLGCAFVSSVAFSLDNILAIGSPSDIKLYDVKTHSFISTLPFTGSLTFSPDCTRFASARNDRIYLWDLQGIDTFSPAPTQATALISVALSRDCSRLAYGYGGDRLELWGTSPAMQRIASHKAYQVSDIEFGPDGSLFASHSSDGTIKLWNGGDGSLHGTIQAHSELRAVALSNSVLVAGGKGFVTLWSLDTLSLIHTFHICDEYSATTVSISDEGDLVAFRVGQESINVFDVENRTIIATFKVPESSYEWTFLPDKSHLVVKWPQTSAFVSMNVTNKRISKRPIFEHLIQLPNMPLWHGVPIWYAQEPRCVSALFSQDQIPVPVLCIPTNLSVSIWAEGSSMIALGCSDGRIVLLRLSAKRFSQHMHCPSHAVTRFGDKTSSALSARYTFHSRNEQQEGSSSHTADEHAPIARVDEGSNTEHAKHAGRATAKRRTAAIVPPTDRVSTETLSVKCTVQ